MKTRQIQMFMHVAALGVIALLLGNAAAMAQVLPDKLPPMPAIPAPKPPASVPLGNPQTTPESKMTFPMAPGPFQPTWDSINANYKGEPVWLRDAKFGFWVHFGPQAAGQSGDWYARRLYLPGQTAYVNHLRDYGPPSQTGYMDVLHTWNPKALDPAQLVQLYHDAGARFLLTQAIFDMAGFTEWMDAVRKAGLDKKAAILASVLPLPSADRARQLQAHDTYGPIGDDIIDRLAKASDPAKAGITLAAQVAAKLKTVPGVRGIHILSGGCESSAALVLKEAGLA